MEDIGDTRGGAGDMFWAAAFEGTTEVLGTSGVQEVLACWR